VRTEHHHEGRIEPLQPVRGRPGDDGQAQRQHECHLHPQTAEGVPRAQRPRPAEQAQAERGQREDEEAADHEEQDAGARCGPGGGHCGAEPRHSRNELPHEAAAVHLADLALGIGDVHGRTGSG
jgi:hypothetical protein